jgi:hypothetical protein
MDIVWTLVEGLTSSEDHFSPTAYLHYNGPLQYVDKHVSIMAMYEFRAAWRVHNSDHRAFFSRELGETLREQGGYLNLLREQPVGNEAGQAQD